jgi:hypothetical protein
MNDDLPKMATRLEVLVCLDRFVKRENAIHDRLNGGEIHKAGQLLQICSAADQNPKQLSRPSDEREGLKFATKSADTTYDCNATAHSRGIDGARQGFRTTDLEHQVHAAAVGQSLDDLLPFPIRTVVDCFPRAERLCAFKFRVAGRGNDAAQARCFGQLQRPDRNPAGTQYQHRVARLQAACDKSALQAVRPAQVRVAAAGRRPDDPRALFAETSVADKPVAPIAPRSAAISDAARR